VPSSGASAWSGWHCGPFWPVKGLLMTAAVVVLAVVVVVLVSSVLVYNGLVRRRDQVDDAWNQIEMCQPQCTHICGRAA
jgi:hypothetical protein